MDERRCTRCKEIKDISKFGKRTYQYKTHGTKYYYRTQCNVCRVEMQKYIYYTPERRDARKLQRQQTKEKLVQRFGNCCFDCKQSFPNYVYDFHHLDSSQKDHQISKLLLYKTDKLERELTKCIMLCSNCHKIRHWKDKQTS